ncbi:hypothetical protein ZWY2020_025524 [Hordeum vulgare]|nr:hypothetical protein ZWY2020_025524 [Hordeum vulgare]
MKLLEPRKEPLASAAADAAKAPCKWAMKKKLVGGDATSSRACTSPTTCPSSGVLEPRAPLPSRFSTGRLGRLISIATSEIIELRHFLSSCGTPDPFLGLSTPMAAVDGWSETGSQWRRRWIRHKWRVSMGRGL